VCGAVSGQVFGFIGGTFTERMIVSKNGISSPRMNDSRERDQI
jgi:hypothetical protein